MSRWSEEFKVHEFHTVLKDYQEDINDLDISEISDLPELDEISRLKKILLFISSYIKLIDPELNKPTALDGILSHMNNSVAHFNNYKSDANIAHLVNANSYIDNAVDTLNSLNTKIVKFTGKSIASLIGTYEETVSEALERLDLAATLQASNNIKELEKELLNDGEDNESVKTKITAFYDDIESKSEEIDVYHNKTFVDNESEEELSVSSKIKKGKDNIFQDIEDVKSKLIEGSNELEELEKFHIKVFGKLDKADEGKRVGGLEQELDDRLKQLKSLEGDQSTIHNALVKEIKSLLPSATSVGLSKEYNKQRSKFAAPIKNWNAMFITTLLVMFLITVFSFFEIYSTEADTSFKFIKATNFQETLNNLLIRIPLYGPLVWLAIYSGRRRSEYLRLEQEYVHKETLAMSFSSYKKQIEDLHLNDTSLSEKLLDSSISTLSYNASDSLDNKHHKENTPIGEVVENLGKVAETLKDSIKLSK